MIASNLPALQVITPLVAALFCALIPMRRFAWLFACVVSFLTFAISLLLAQTVLSDGPISYAMGNWIAPYGIEYRVDLLNSFILVIVSGISAITSLYAYASVNDEIEASKQPLFYSAFLLCLAGLLGIVITNDAFNIYVFLEISSLATYALVAMGKDRRALMASFEYLILGTIGATFILIAIGLLYMMTGTLNISDMAVRIPAIAYTTPVKAAMAFFTVGLALKIAIFPLHLWLTNSYTNAPSFISAFLSATATKVGIYVLIRIIFTLFDYKFTLDEMAIGKILITLSLFAILVGSLVAVFQSNIKRMLAYSSVAQLGYIILGISLASVIGLSAALIHIFYHALAKGALFMAAGCVMLRINGVRLHNLKGIASKMPVTMAAFVIAGLSLVGLPLTGGFISKWYLLQALFDKGLWPVFAVIVISSLLALVYIWRIIEVAYFKEAVTSTGQIKEAPLSMLIPLWTMVAMTVFFGVYTAPVLSFAEKTSKYLFSF